MDCDDDDPDVHPDAEEYCDDVDSDCDGLPDDKDALDTTHWRPDNDGDGYGQGGVVTACAQPDGYVAASGDCDDDDDAVNPDADDPCGDHLDTNCDDRPDGCLDDDELWMYDGDLHLIGVDGEDHAGAIVSGAGDVDGDDLNDIIVGAVGNSVGAHGTLGFVYVLRGGGVLDGFTGSMSLSGSDIIVASTEINDGFGTAAASAGDVDGDGLDDLILGAFQGGEGGEDAGAAYLMLGGGVLLGAEGTTSPADCDRQFIGDAAGNYLGVSVASAGDVDGDGLDDLLIAAAAGEGRLEGGTALFLGGGVIDGAAGTLDFSRAEATLIGGAGSTYAHKYVTGLGDVDGDGLADVLMGMPLIGDADFRGGAALFLGDALIGGADVYWARDSQLLLRGEDSYDNAGEAVGAAGDVDGDGLDDAILSAAYLTYGRKWSGAAYLVLSSGTLSSDAGELGFEESDIIFYGDQGEQKFGDSVGGAGDVDGDGLVDVLVGATGNNDGADDSGAAYLFLGGGSLAEPTGVRDASAGDYTLIGDNSYSRTGWDVSDNGDIDGDGLDDIIVGAYWASEGISGSGAAYVFLGGRF